MIDGGDIGRFLADDSGVSIVEYGLLLGLVALACLASMVSLGQDIRRLLTDVAGALAAAASKI